MKCRWVSSIISHQREKDSWWNLFGEAWPLFLEPLISWTSVNVLGTFKIHLLSKCRTRAASPPNLSRYIWAWQASAINLRYIHNRFPALAVIQTWLRSANIDWSFGGCLCNFINTTPHYSRLEEVNLAGCNLSSAQTQAFFASLATTLSQRLVCKSFTQFPPEQNCSSIIT